MQVPMPPAPTTRAARTAATKRQRLRSLAQLAGAAVVVASWRSRCCSRRRAHHHPGPDRRRAHALVALGMALTYRSNPDPQLRPRPTWASPSPHPSVPAPIPRSGVPSYPPGGPPLGLLIAVALRPRAGRRPPVRESPHYHHHRHHRLLERSALALLVPRLWDTTLVAGRIGPPSLRTRVGTPSRSQRRQAAAPAPRGHPDGIA